LSLIATIVSNITICFTMDLTIVSNFNFLDIHI
jgi:hypothetical protein